MNILLDPNVAYIILVMGFFLAILALFAPGTGLLEAGALIALLLSGYAMYNLPINGWAVVLLVVSIFPFVWSLRRPHRPIFLVISVAAMILGSVGLFRTESGGFAVNPLLAVIVSITVPILLWVFATKGLQAMRKKPTHDLGELIGRTGEAKTDIDPINEGSVYVGGETWSARSSAPIKSGTLVRVIQREGFILDVEPVAAPAAAPPEPPAASPQ